MDASTTSGGARWLPGAPAPAEDDIVKCVACGLCLPHCPTFRLTGRETAAPRGRVAAMRAVQEGRAGVDGAFAAMMDECLACRACETACPSGVPYGRMIEAARAQVEVTRPVRVRGLRGLALGQVMSRTWAMRAMAVGLGVTQALRIDRLLPERMTAGAPRVSLPRLARRMPVRLGSGPVAAVLRGCVMDVAFRPVQEATMRAVAACGHTAVMPDGGCCGALAAHYGHPQAARRMARARIAEFEALGAEAVVVNSAGCSAHMKQWGHLLADDPAWAGRAHAMAARVRDVLELDVPSEATTTRPVAVHDACHHVNGQGIRAETRRMVAASGARPVEIPDDGRCCGAAGMYSVLQPEMSAELRLSKARAIAASGADTVACANPGCAAQIAAGLREIGADVDVRHPVELLRPRERT
ncbi:MAG: 4Fe-4S dicluster domain-containing protein [Thermoleophilia bacterium]|nr:4Fe-4S dicluster domain-containing protein [Thermoleophilia bacterium]